MELGKVDQLRSGHKTLNAIPEDQQTALVIADDRQVERAVGVHHFLGHLPRVAGWRGREDKLMWRPSLGGIHCRFQRHRFGRIGWRRRAVVERLFHSKQGRPVTIIYLWAGLRVPCLLLTHTTQPLHPCKAPTAASRRRESLTDNIANRSTAKPTDLSVRPQAVS